MQDWEIKRRAELNESVKDGFYHIGAGAFIAGTGKAGYINYQIELERFGREKLPDNKGLEDLIDKPRELYKPLTESELTQFIKDLYERTETKDNK